MRTKLKNISKILLFSFSLMLLSACEDKQEKVWITLSSTEKTMTIGDAYQFKAHISTSGGEVLNSDVIWEIYDQKYTAGNTDKPIAAIDESGLISALNYGSLKVRAKLKSTGQIAIASVVVRDYVVVDKVAIKFLADELYLAPSNFQDTMVQAITDQRVPVAGVWTSSDPSVVKISATYNSDGYPTVRLLPDLKAGVLSATADVSVDVGGTVATLKVYVGPMVDLSFGVADKPDLTKAYEIYASLPVDGEIVAKDSLYPIQAYVTLLTDYPNLDEIKDQLYGEGSSDRGYGKWTVDGNSVAMIDRTWRPFSKPAPGFDGIPGKIAQCDLRTGKQIGECNVYFTLRDKTIKAAVTVVNKNNIRVEKVELDGKAKSLRVGQAFTIKATASPSGVISTWGFEYEVIGDASILEIEADKLAPGEFVVKGIKAGAVTVRIKCRDKYADCVVTVKPAVISINLSPSRVTDLVIGTTTTWTYDITPVEAVPYYTIVWTSLDPSIAVVDQLGNITSVALGGTRIKLQVKDNESKELLDVTSESSISVVPPQGDIIFTPADIDKDASGISIDLGAANLLISAASVKPGLEGTFDLNIGTTLVAFTPGTYTIGNGLLPGGSFSNPAGNETTVLSATVVIADGAEIGYFDVQYTLELAGGATINISGTFPDWGII